MFIVILHINLLSYIAIGDRVVWEHCAFYNRIWRIRLPLGICRLKKIVVKQEKIYNTNKDNVRIISSIIFDHRR